MYGVHHSSMSCAVHLSAASATAVRAASRRYLRRPMSEPNRPMYGVHLFCMPCAVHLSAAAATTAVRATSRRYLQWSVSQPD